MTGSPSFTEFPDVYGSRFRKVELTDPNRGGLLGQGSILTATSYPTRTSVVLRGKWVLENLLGSPPPPPPANVPPLELHGKGRQLSMREAMEIHRANPVCASCHARMDPIGFALENYDGIGAWRTSDNGVAVECFGQTARRLRIHGAGGAQEVVTYAASRGISDYLLGKVNDLCLGPRIGTFRPACLAGHCARSGTTGCYGGVVD